MTRTPSERRPPGGAREAAASEEKKNEIHQKNTTAGLLRQAGANVCGIVGSTSQAVAVAFREKRYG